MTTISNHNVLHSFDISSIASLRVRAVTIPDKQLLIMQHLKMWISSLWAPGVSVPCVALSWVVLVTMFCIIPISLLLWCQLKKNQLRGIHFAGGNVCIAIVLAFNFVSCWMRVVRYNKNCYLQLLSKLCSRKYYIVSTCTMSRKLNKASDMV